jgi:hypothetical protein
VAKIDDVVVAVLQLGRYVSRHADRRFFCVWYLSGEVVFCLDNVFLKSLFFWAEKLYVGINCFLNRVYGQQFRLEILTGFVLGT